MNDSRARILLVTFQANPAAASVKGGCYGCLPLHVAIRCALLTGDESIVKALIKASPKAITVADEHGNLPLHYACGCNDEKVCLPVVKLILEAYPEGASASGQWQNFHP